MSEKNIDPNDMTHIFDNWNPTPEELEEFTEKLSKWSISKGDEYIKKEDAIRHFQSFEKTMKSMPLADVKARLKDLPTYSFPEREKGEWIELPKAFNANENPCECSKCRHILSFMNGYPKSNFCPNCGADMRGKDK